MTTPWYVKQPRVDPLDLERPIEEIVAATEAACRQIRASGLRRIGPSIWRDAYAIRRGTIAVTSSVLSSVSLERVRAALLAGGLQTEIVELPGAARTAKAAADYLGCEVAEIANSLVFRAQSSDRAVLVMSSGARRVDTDALSAVLGEPIGKADADFVRKHSRIRDRRRGAGRPYRECRQIVERALSECSEIWAAGGHPHTVFRSPIPSSCALPRNRRGRGDAGLSSPVLPCAKPTDVCRSP